MTQHDYADIALFIAGTWIGPEERETQPVINPATAQQIGLIAKATPDDLEASVRSARVAFEGWRQLSPLDRSAILRRFANLLRENEQAIAAAITLDEGKPLAEAIVEVRSSADHIDWHAEEGRRIYGRIIPSRSPAVQQQVLREPVGVCLAITPWNFPLSQAVRKVAAALACGCTMILKGPAEAPSACMAIARYLQEAGLPDGCLNLVWGNAAMISETLVAHPDVRKITFTGSVEVGKSLAELAGRHMKRATMELGGHAPVLIFDDADAEATARVLAGNKLRNAGQVCISPTRFFVQASVHKRFVAALVDAFATVKVGDGLEPDIQMGPVCHARRIAEMERLVDDARAENRGDGGGQRVHGAKARSRPRLIGRPGGLGTTAWPPRSSGSVVTCGSRTTPPSSRLCTRRGPTATSSPSSASTTGCGGPPVATAGRSWSGA